MRILKADMKKAIKFRGFKQFLKYGIKIVGHKNKHFHIFPLDILANMVPHVVT